MDTITQESTSIVPVTLPEYHVENPIIRLPKLADLPVPTDDIIDAEWTQIFPDYRLYGSSGDDDDDDTLGDFDDDWSPQIKTMTAKLNEEWAARDPHKHGYTTTVGDIVDEYKAGLGRQSMPKAKASSKAAPAKVRPDGRQAQAAVLPDVFALLGAFLDGLMGLFLLDWVFGPSNAEPSPVVEAMPLTYFLVGHDQGTMVRDFLKDHGLKIFSSTYTNTADGQLYQFKFGVPVKLAGWCGRLLEELNVDWERL